jgi:glycosyltransferase involved in cell wall biosynthesis
MKILVVNQFFYPDVSAVAQQLTDLCEDLVAAGDQVTVISGRGQYQPGAPPLAARQDYRGIHIQRVATPNLGKRNVFTRLADLLVFYAAAFWALVRAPRPDVIYVISTPPLVCLPALAVGWLRRIPVVYGIHDLYPDIAVALGVLREGWITRLIDAVSVRAMRRMRRLIVLGRFAKERLLAKGIPSSQVVVLENWADSATTQPVVKDHNPFLRQRGLGDKFIVLYSGNMGVAHEFATVLEAARRLRDRPDIVFLFIGGGARRREIEAFKTLHALDNVRLEPYQERSNLSQSLSAGDVFLVTLLPGSEGLVLPCKVYAGMAVARPILFVGTEVNDTAEAITRAGCGWVIRPGDVDSLLSRILELQQKPELARAYGERGRQALRRWNDRGHATAGYRQVFAEAIQ